MTIMEYVRSGVRPVVTLGFSGAFIYGFVVGLISSDVFVGVVGFLEAVEIDAQDGKLLRVPFGALERFRQALVERRAVRQVGQRVVVRQMRTIRNSVAGGTACSSDLVRPTYDGCDGRRQAISRSDNGHNAPYPLLYRFGDVRCRAVTVTS